MRCVYRVRRCVGALGGRSRVACLRLARASEGRTLMGLTESIVRGAAVIPSRRLPSMYKHGPARAGEGHAVLSRRNIFFIILRSSRGVGRHGRKEEPCSPRCREK